jgi:crotonobetainyl-CoA:carnitine CoA-transferase CaiB-like acyl-CoA transferase
LGTERGRRLKTAGAIDSRVAEWIADRNLDVVMSRFNEFEVAAGPVYDAQQLLEDPHMEARNAFAGVPDADLGHIRLQAPVPRFSDTDAVTEHAGRRSVRTTTRSIVSCSE